jgi:hypothetical protein
MNWLRSNCYQRNFCSVPRIFEGFYFEALLIELNGTNRWTDCYLYKKNDPIFQDLSHFLEIRPPDSGGRGTSRCSMFGFPFQPLGMFL